MKVPQHLIDEATRRGIVEGVTIACSDNQSHGIVSPIDEWHSYDSGTLVVGTDDAGDWLCAKWQKNAWATVITPAPSQGLEEGMATECSPAMRAAIIELAKELGLPDSGCLGQGLPYLVWWTGQLSSYHHGREAKVKLAPEDFIAKMRATAKKPKPIKIGNDVVEFRKGGIRVGCTTVDNETVRAIAANLKD